MDRRMSLWSIVPVVVVVVVVVVIYIQRMAVDLPILRASRRAWGCPELRNYIQSKPSESISSRSRALKLIHCYLPGHLGWSARYKNSKRDIPRVALRHEC